MVRPVWHSQRYNEADTNETLQSDVMRFMAILALCLVAIFALVQSLPLHPLEPEQASSPAPVKMVAAEAQPVLDPPADLPVPVMPQTEHKSMHELPLQPIAKFEQLDEPVVEQPAASKPVEQYLPEPVAEVTKPLQPIPKIKLDEPEVEKPAASKPVEQQLHEPITEFPMPLQNQKTAPMQEQSSTPETDHVEEPQALPESSATTMTSDKPEGLSLRFASDSALLALVAKRRVDVYGWVEKDAWRLLAERGVLSFVTASVPKRFHSMTPETVPSDIVRSFNLNVPGMHASSITWGVTLPADTTRQLKRLVNKHSSGTLVIDANGRVRFQSTG